MTLYLKIWELVVILFFHNRVSSPPCIENHGLNIIHFPLRAFFVWWPNIQGIENIIDAFPIRLTNRE